MRSATWSLVPINLVLKPLSYCTKSSNLESARIPLLLAVDAPAWVTTSPKVPIASCLPFLAYLKEVRLPPLLSRHTFCSSGPSFGDLQWLSGAMRWKDILEKDVEEEKHESLRYQRSVDVIKVV